MDMKETTLFVVTNSLLFCMLLLSLFVLHNDVDSLQKENDLLNFKLDRFKMYYENRFAEELDDDLVPSALYFSDGYMTVWLEGREYEEVMESCNHEWLHYKYDMSHWVQNGDEE